MNRKPWLASYGSMPAEIDADAYPSVVALMEEAMGRFADKPAFTCFGQTLSYADVDRLSRAFAAYLQVRLGVRKGDRVALMTPNFIAFPIACLGIARAGAVQVNVNPLYTPRELEHQLRDAGATAAYQTLRMLQSRLGQFRHTSESGVTGAVVTGLGQVAAGITGYMGAMDELAVEGIGYYHDIMRTNVDGVLFAMRHELPVMRAAGGGIIVNTGSSLSHKGSAHMAAYAASKHAVIGLTRSAAAREAAGWR